jgi:cyclophilin family peptidyl-prolyl cis-trans isomerase
MNNFFFSRRLSPNISAFSLLACAAVAVFVFHFARWAEDTENVLLARAGGDFEGRPAGAILATSLGEIELRFIAGHATATVRNFAALAERQFYNGTKFHRVIPDFMIQGGDPLTKDEAKKDLWGSGGPDYEFEDEPSTVALVSGVVAMANRGPNTNGSQFFIITAPATPWLQGKHTPFARVVRGMDVVQNISRLPRDARDVPRKPAVIVRVVLK